MAVEEARVHVLRDLRRLLRWQSMLGITGFGATEELRRFLRPRPQRREEARAQGQTRQVAGKRGETLQGFREELAGCRRCPMHLSRQGMSLGRGTAGGRLLFVGDWSRQQGGAFASEVVLGTQEDQMVLRMAAAIKLTPEDIALTNLLKCCPLPGDEPSQACVECCRDHLEMEISLIQPAALCLLGGTAAQIVLRQRVPLARLRGRRCAYRCGAETIPAMPTFHPSLLLRQPECKKAVWQDLQCVQRWLAGIR